MLYAVLRAAASDPRPDDNDVVAGWLGFAVFAFLIVAVAFLCWSFTKQLKKVRAAREAGLYDESGSEPDSEDQLPPTHRHGV
jgi:hypothetical protein